MRSFLGAHVRGLGGSVAAGDAVTLLGAAGCSENGVRTALSRLKARGTLLAEDGRYRLSPAALRDLERGDRRIYGYHPMAEDDPWMVVLFSVPESDRPVRHRLRSELTRLGCGAVAPGSWVGPGHLADEAVEVLTEQDLARYVTVFRAARPVTAADRVPSWWDLDGLARRHHAFLDEMGPIERRWSGDGGTDEQAFVDHLNLVDAWRELPYLDPGLPESLLPPGWPGREGVALFARLNGRLEPPARAHVRAVIEGGAP
nr:PaaX family transcriptional regulator C-terminal domain-containing protein [Pseudonocardia sp. C8]